MPNVLLIDDNPHDRRLVIHELEQSFATLAVHQVSRAAEFEQALASWRFDVVITDYQLRWSDGLVILKTIKACFPDCPVIMFTDSGTQEVAIEAMKSGLEDYVVKSPSHYVRLPAAVRLVLKRAEERRKMTGLEYRLQTLLNQLNVGIYRMTTEGALLEGNKAFLRLLGLDHLTKLPDNQTLEPYFPPDDYVELLDQLKRKDEVRDRDLELCRADGTKHWVRISKTFTTLDQVELVDGLIESIHERKQAEAEREELLVRERAARAEAEAANRQKDDFLAIVSHELRTPLNSILGWSHMLLARKLDEATTQKALETIGRNAKLQNKLIDDILDVSRIIQGKFQLTMQPMYLLTTIEAAIESIRSAIDAKSIQLHTVIDPNVGEVLGDSSRLQQVVWNLLSNAVKFTPAGGQITVQLEQQLDSYAQITVTDTGTGIEAEFLPYIFERFRQADTSKARSQMGLGLGLAIARSIVELHNGAIWATSEGKGKGATFVVQIPLHQSLQASADNDANPSSDFPNLDGLQALIVDDDADTLELIRYSLEQCQAQVTAVTSAQAAFEAITRSPFHIFISDIGMPQEDGYSLIRRIRAWEIQHQRAAVPAIVLTAFAREEDQQEALAAGFQQHLSKPINPFELVSLVTNLCTKLIQS